MKKLAIVAAICGLCLSVQPALAASYDFNVLYSGGGNAVLAGVGDDPTAITLVDGDTFSWDIKAQAGGYWNVVTGGDFFPLMAFGVSEAGLRIGDFTLTLRKGGADVFSTSEIAAENRFVHIGTNTISLVTGLQFDEMHLDYALGVAFNEDTLSPIGSTPSGLLPIFGAPEQNPYYPGIAYAVPEPGTWALMLGGLGLLGGLARRRSVAHNA